MNNIKTAVAGNQWITEYLVEELIRSKYPPHLIINSSPDSAHNICGYKNLRKFADEQEIEILHPKSYSLTDNHDKEILLSKKIDILLVFGWQRLIPEWLIDHCLIGAFGVHGGPKKPPRCRGRAVLNWSILMGYKNFYMYLFKLTPAVDEGEIIDMIQFNITPFDDILSVYHKNCVVSTRMFLKNLPCIIEGKTKTIKPDNCLPSYLPKRTPAHSGINWEAPAEKIINLIRAVTFPYPSAFTFIDGMEIKIFSAHIFDSAIQYSDTQPGKILDVFPNGDFVIGTQNFSLYIREYDCSDKSKIQRGIILKLRSGEQIPDPEI